MKFILGTKQHMVQYFDAEGKAFAATVVEATPNTVTEIRTKERDGYSAIQVGMGEQKKERINKSVLGHTKDLGAFKKLSEMRVENTDGSKIGDKIDVSIFAKGDVVRVAGITKGKGFQGVVKRHGFHGGRRSHGQKHSEREPGSIGGGLRNRVPKGMRMAGRMGSDRIKVGNLRVLDVDTNTNQIIISGAIPGRRGTVVEITG